MSFEQLTVLLFRMDNFTSFAGCWRFTNKAHSKEQEALFKKLQSPRKAAIFL